MRFRESLGFAAVMFIGLSTRLSADPGGHGSALLSAARPLARLDSLRQWTGELGPPFNEPVWLNGSTVLAHSNCGDGFLCGIYRLNLRTGKKWRQRRLDAVIRNYKPGDWKLSANRKWLLWRQGWNDPQYYMVATRVDGGRIHRWKAHMPVDPSSFCWLGDTTKWVDFWSAGEDHIDTAVVYDLAHPNKRRIHHLPRLLTTEALGSMSQNKTLMMERVRPASKNGSYSFAEVFLGLKQARVRAYKVKQPAAGTVIQVTFAPDKKHLAWLVESPKANYERALGNRDPIVASLCITNTKGRHARSVGNVKYTREYDELIMHGWTPGSGGILVTFRNRLYLARVLRNRPTAHRPVG